MGDNVLTQLPPYIDDDYSILFLDQGKIFAWFQDHDYVEASPVGGTRSGLLVLKAILLMTAKPIDMSFRIISRQQETPLVPGVLLFDVL